MLMGGWMADDWIAKIGPTNVTLTPVLTKFGKQVIRDMVKVFAWQMFFLSIINTLIYPDSHEKLPFSSHIYTSKWMNVNTS